MVLGRDGMAPPNQPPLARLGPAAPVVSIGLQIAGLLEGLGAAAEAVLIAGVEAEIEAVGLGASGTWALDTEDGELQPGEVRPVLRRDREPSLPDGGAVLRLPALR